MRWSNREGPWGSHQLLASALKWDTSVGSTEEVELSDGVVVVVVVEESRKGRLLIAGTIVEDAKKCCGLNCGRKSL